MANMPGVMIYFDLRPCLTQLSAAEKGRLLEAILDYSEFGTVPDFSGKLGIAWGFLRPKLDRDRDAYARKVQQRKYAVYVRESKKSGTPPLSFEEWAAALADGNHRKTSDDTISYPTTTTTSTPTATTTPTATRENCCVTGAVKPPRQPPQRLVSSQRGESRVAGTAWADSSHPIPASGNGQMLTAYSAPGQRKAAENLRQSPTNGCKGAEYGSHLPGRQGTCGNPHNAPKTGFG